MIIRESTTLTKRDKVNLAKEVLMTQIRQVGYGARYDDYVTEIGSEEEADKIMYQLMLKVGKALGYSENEVYFN